MYTREEAACWAANAKHAIEERFDQRELVLNPDTALRQLAESSTWYRELGGRPPREVEAEGRGRPADGHGSAESSTARATRGSPSSTAGGGALGDAEAQPSVVPDEARPPPYQNVGLLEPEAEDADDPADDGPWFICANGLAAARAGGGTVVPALDWTAEPDEEP